MKWVHIRERLFSSARYGKYWELSFPFLYIGDDKELFEQYNKRFESFLNDAPYEPLLEFAIPSEYVADVLTTNREASDVAYWLYYSKPFREQLSTAKLISPHECPTIRDGECRVLVFNIEKTVSLRKLKKFFVEYVEEQESESEYEQGNLRVSDYGLKYSVYDLFSEWNQKEPLNFIFKEHRLHGCDYFTSIFNHHVIFKRPKKLYSVAYGANMTLTTIFITEGVKEVQCFAADHEPLKFKPADYTSIIEFEHNIPQNTEVDRL